MEYTAGSLFSGIGGIDYAFSSAGFDVRFQVEIDPFCRKVLQKHAPAYWRNAIIHEDVKHVGKHNLETVDVIAGGFPCQDVSMAGERAGVKRGTRSGLWYEFSRIIGELRPRVVLLENVDGIYTLGGTTVIGHLTQMGYDCFWLPVFASDVNSPHERERWIAVGYASGERGSRFWVQDRNGATEAARGKQTIRRENRFNARMGTPFYPLHRTNAQRVYQSRVERNAHGVSDGMDRHTFPAYKGHAQKPTEPPYILPKKKEDKERHKSLGNAVVPQIIYPFALTIRKWLEIQDAAQPQSSEVAA